MPVRKRIVKGLKFELSSGNVFADLDMWDAEKLKIKSGLVIQIIKAVRRLGQGLIVPFGSEPFTPPGENVQPSP